MGLEQIRVVLRLTPDPELITTLIERWRLETNTFHLYHGEATITLEDIHFITGLSIDSLPVTSDNLIPTGNDELAAYVGSLLGGHHGLKTRQDSSYLLDTDNFLTRGHYSQ
ncbi:Protein MAIN-LIKE 2 [Linum perenne]